VTSAAQRQVDADLVVAFLNTYDTETGTDAIDTQAAWDSWAARRQLPPAGPLATARTVRDGLRAIAAGDASASELTVPVAAGLVDGRPRAVPLDAIGAVLLAAVRLADEGDWARVKLCAAETCRWAFLDESRNRSRSWCSMETCGNRAKARSFRSRARSNSD
jgi:predicted RNA-binding Zn ribbon-like protein